MVSCISSKSTCQGSSVWSPPERTQRTHGSSFSRPIDGPWAIHVVCFCQIGSDWFSCQPSTPSTQAFWPIFSLRFLPSPPLEGAVMICQSFQAKSPRPHSLYPGGGWSFQLLLARCIRKKPIMLAAGYLVWVFANQEVGQTAINSTFSMSVELFQGRSP